MQYTAQNKLNTVDRLMNSHAIMDKVLAKSCIDGLTQFAAELRQKGGSDGRELSPFLRKVVQQLEYYWGLDEDAQENFDRRMNEADAAHQPWHPTPEQKGGAVYGLYRYAMDMVSSHGVETKEYVNDCKMLIQGIVSLWKLDRPVSDQMCINIDTALAEKQIASEQQMTGP